MQKSARRKQAVVQLRLPSQLGFEKIAMDATARLACVAGFSDERTRDLCTAIAEACINAMQHGNQLATNKYVDIQFYLGQQTLEIEIYDRGEGIQAQPPIPVLEKKLTTAESSRGWGLFLIENLVDKVEFLHKGNQGHVTRLVMKRPRAVAA